MAIDIVVETFEDNAKRILWLPSITLGYVYTLSGDILHFALAVAAIGGAQLFRFLMKSDFASERDIQSNFEWVGENFSKLQVFSLAGIAVFYFFALVYAPLQLYLNFAHNNVVLVGLAGIWWGVLIVITVNATVASSVISSG
jgi:hypothetical protein